MLIERLYRKAIRILAPHYLKSVKGISISNKTIINGRPKVKCDVGKIIIKNNVTLNSTNNGYHVNMHSPVKLYTSTKHAIIQIGSNSRIHGTCIHAYNRISIGENCLIAANCQIFDSNRHELSFHNPVERLNTINDSKPINIKDNVWIGANSIILPGVTIGEGSVVAAGSVVTKSVPPFTLVGGNPSKIIKQYN